MKSVWINENSWKDVEDYLRINDIVIIPIGSTEQHGLGLPIGLDSYVAISLAEDVAKKTGVLVTPPIWFGDSPHHMDFPGTISIRTEVLTEYVKDIIRSLAKHGFRKIIIINGHKITNLDSLHSATRNIKEYELQDIFMAVIDPIKIGFDIASQIKESDEHHAGELEASQMLYKFPGLVEMDKIQQINPLLKDKYSKFMKSDLFSGGNSIDIVWSSKEQRAFTEGTGSISDATKATVEKGRLYHENMVDKIVELIEWVKNH